MSEIDLWSNKVLSDKMSQSGVFFFHTWGFVKVGFPTRVVTGGGERFKQPIVRLADVWIKH